MRDAIFISLVGLICGAGALASIFLIVNGKPASMILLAVCLLIALPCFFAVRSRSRDIRKGPSHVPARVTRKRRHAWYSLAGSGCEIEITILSETRPARKPERFSFQVSREDFDRVHEGHLFRLLRYPHSKKIAAFERYDGNVRDFIGCQVRSRGGYWVAPIGDPGGLILVALVAVLLLPLWLLAYVIARIAVRRETHLQVDSLC